MIKMQKDRNEALWIKGMKFGNILGCHQMPERSFFVKGYQMPVCARCCGVIVGYIIFLLTNKVYSLGMGMSFVCCGIMFIDWFVQYIQVLQSNNIRRVITGIIGGYGFISLVINIILLIIRGL
ncbi:MAG: DUF2085 domain-containing protein [Cellulosilyticaceae bacterium]